MPMVRFIILRLFHGLLILLGVSFITYLLINQSPGSYFDKLLLDPQIPQEWVAQERERLGLDRPWLVGYGLWLKGIVTELNFGKSFEYKVPVFDVLLGRVLNTLLLSFCAIAFAWIVSIPLGIVAAARQYSWIDKGAALVAFIGISVPNVFFALLAVYFAAQTGWFPAGGLTDQRNWSEFTAMQKFFDMAHHLVLPTIVLGTAMMAALMRQMRGQLLDVLRSDYVRTARAKGLAGYVVLFKHAVRNAINPLITLFGFSLSDLLSGSVLVEQVFSYPGLGRLTFRALIDQDVYLVMAAVLTGAAMLILGNTIADIMLAWSDPRIKLEDRLKD